MMAYSQMVMAAQARQAELLRGLDEARPARPARTMTRMIGSSDRGSVLPSLSQAGVVRLLDFRFGRE
jgi:hypothetical protein